MGAPAAPDLFDPEFYEGDPIPAYRWLRSEAPVYWNPVPFSSGTPRAPGDGGFWALSRHADVCEVGRQPEIFSSASGIIVESPATTMINMMTAGSLIGSDPPAHRELRRAVMEVFKPRAVTGLEPIVRRHVTTLLDRITPGEPFDLIETVAAPLPTWVVGDLLETPEDDRHRLESLVDAALSYADPGTSFEEIGPDALTTMFEYFSGLVAERRAAPGDDLVSAVLEGTLKGVPIGDGEAIQSSFVLLVAGTETVRTAIANGLLTLLDHPDAEAQLRADRSLLPGAIDELMRYRPPVNYFCRTARSDYELRGTKITAGQQVMMHYAAANRDEEVFGADADELVLTRHPNPHVSFGFGEHACIGAQLGRLQVRVFFEEWFDRFSTLELAEPPERFRNTNVNGIRRMSVSACPG
jgi:cytochrome P450